MRVYSFLIYSFLFSILLCSTACFAQPDAAALFDLSAISNNDKEKFEVDAKLDYIAFIDADGEQGQGVFVAKDLILTSYSLLLKKKSVSYRTQSDPTPKKITGYVAADPKNGLVLVRTPKLNEKYLTLEYTEGFSAAEKMNVHYLYTHNQQVRLGEAFSVPLPATGQKRPTETSLIRLTLPANTTLNGHLIISRERRRFDTLSYSVGLAVKKDGISYLAPGYLLQSLYFHRNLEEKSFERLTIPRTRETKALYRTELSFFDVYEHVSDTSRVYRLAYIEKAGQNITLHIQFSPVKRTALFDPFLHLVDLDRGMIYHSDKRQQINNRAYANTVYNGSVGFPGAASADRISLVEMPDDAEFWNHVRRLNRGSDSGDYPSWFSSIIIGNYPKVRKAEYNLKDDPAVYGTVGFFLTPSQPQHLPVTISGNSGINGTLTSYYKERPKVLCGAKGAYTLRLPAGVYTYRARARNGSVITRKFKVTAGECLNEEIIF